MIATACENCGKTFKLKDSMAGKKGKCACGTVIAVPNPEPAQPDQDPFAQIEATPPADEVPFVYVPQSRTAPTKTKWSIKQADASVSESAAWDRFVRGGIFGVIDERFCRPKTSDIKIKGDTTQQKKRRLVGIAVATIGGFSLIVIIPMVASALFTKPEEHYTPSAPYVPSYTPSYSPPTSSWPTYVPSSPVVSSKPSEPSDADKADYMRDHGFNSFTDGDLARAYDRIKSIDDAKAARDERLGR